MSDSARVTIPPGVPLALVRYEGGIVPTATQAILDLEYLCLLLGVTHPGEWPMLRASAAPDIGPEGVLYVIDLCCDRIVERLNAEQRLVEALVGVAVSGPAGDGPRQEALDRYIQLGTYLTSFRRASALLLAYRQAVEASSTTMTEGVSSTALARA